MLTQSAQEDRGVLIPALAELASQVLGIVDKAVPDRELREKLRAELSSALLQQSSRLAELQAGIVSSEVKSESWLTRNWRPIVMLVFTGLLVADWLGYSAPNLSPELKLRLFDIIHLGLGGYVIGRSAEKVLPQVARILKGT